MLLFFILNKAIGNYLLLNPGGKLIFFSMYILRALIALHAAWCAVKWLYFLLVKTERMARYANLKLSLLSLLAMGFFCEAIFMFVPQSQGNMQFGLATLPWTIYYEGSRNEKHYRDADLKDRLNNGKKKVFCLGDSFTYGSGIKDPADRYSNIVAQEISKDYEVFNLGKGNSDTRDEFVRLAQFGAVPDVLVLQYYFNDIERAVPQAKKSPSLFLKAGALFTRTSYFLNFLAVNLAKFTQAFQSPDFRKKMADAYNDPECLEAHFVDLQRIIDYCILNKTKMYVLLMPDMRDPGFAERECYPSVKTYLDAKKVTYLGLYEEIKETPVKDLVVSDMDGHANESVQKIIAKKLTQNIAEL